MFEKLKKTLAMLLVFVMVFSIVPANALAEAAKGDSVYSPSVSFFSLFPAEGEGDTEKVDTYEFVVDGTVTASQRVVAGDELLMPATPEKANYKFVGWYEGDAEFTAFGNVSAATGVTHTLTAKFVEVYYVFFKDTTGKVVYTVETVKGGTVSEEAISYATEIVNMTLDAEWSVNGWTDGTTPAGSLVINANTYLTPNVVQGFWVLFDTDGGSYVGPQFCSGGQVFDLGTIESPNKAGYTFDGWYNGSTKVTGTISAAANLTAHWTANTDTKYTVIHWLENADNNNYSFGKAEERYGVTGTETAVVKSGEYEGFTAQPIEQKVILGDGSTIVNVYYKRNVYTVYFLKSASDQGKLICGKTAHTHTGKSCYTLICTDNRWWAHRHNNSCYGDPLVCTLEEHQHTSACYDYSDNVISKITAKYGANISDKWPGGTWKKANGNYQANINTMPLGGDTFYKYTTDNDGESSASYYVQVLPKEIGAATNVKHNGIEYKLDHVDTIQGTGWKITQEDKYEITGFTYATGTENGERFNGAKFFYNRNQYEITFINNGTTEKTVKKYYQEDISSVSYIPTNAPAGKEDYVFGGWYDNELGEGEKYDFSGKMPAQGITVFAKWVEPEFDAVVYLTASASENDTIRVPYGKRITDAPDWAATLEKVKQMNGGSEPDAWTYIDENGNERIFNLTTVLYSDITIYPYYKSQSQGYSVSYSEDGSTSAYDTDKYAVKSYAAIKSPLNAVDRNGNPFLYWTADGTIYYPGDKIEIFGNVTLQAVYGKVQSPVSLHYHANDGSGVTEDVENIPANSVVIVKGEIFTRNGYTFKGWAKTADATEPAFHEGNRILVTASGDNDLYAVWEIIPTYHVIYKDNGKVMDSVKDDTDYYTGDSATVLGSSDIHDNSGKHILVGWVDINSGKIGAVPLTGSIVVNKASDLAVLMENEHFHQFESTVTIGTDDYILYAVWADEGISGKYTVTYDLDGGVSTTETLVYSELSYGVDTPTINEPTKIGYTFKGWDKEIAQYVKEDVTYTAQWEKDDSQTQNTKYTVHYTIEGVEQSADLVEVTGTAWINDDPAQIAIATGGIAAPADKYTGYKLDEANPVYPAEGTMVNTGSEYTVNYVKKTVAWSMEKTLTKINGVTATGSEKASLNDVLTYTITLKNTGEAKIKNITVTDELTGFSTTIDSLEPGAEQSFTTEYTVLESDILRGEIVNTAVADGASETEEATRKEDSVTVNTDEVQGVLTVEKTSDVDDTASLGDVITFTITVSNTGNVTISNIVVEDALNGAVLADESNVIASLAPGEEATVHYTYTVTEDDILSGSIVNNATATGTDPMDSEVNGADDVEVTTDEPDAHFTLQKKTTSEPENGTAYKLGETIKYTVTVTNDGNLTLTDVVVVDELTGDEWTIESLAPGEERTYTPVHEVTEDDVLAGKVVNTVTASGKSADPTNSNPTADPAEAKDSVEASAPSLFVEKKVTSTPENGREYVLGETITYTVFIQNNGNLTITGIVVDDKMEGITLVSDSNEIASLAPGEDAEIEYSYVVTEDDIIAGKVVNAVVVTGTDAGNGTVQDEDEVESTVEPVNSHILMEKVISSTPANGETYALNETISYTITITNDGNMTITEAVVADDLTGESWTIETLAPGDVKTYTTTYTVTEKDIEAGSVLNEVTFVGTDPETNPVEGKDNAEAMVDPVNPALDIDKEVLTAIPERGYFLVGETIEYSITVANIGNVDLHQVVVTDALTGDSWTVDLLQPGESKTYSTSYTVVAEDAGTEGITNTAVVNAKDPTDQDLEPVSDTTRTLPVGAKYTLTVNYIYTDGSAAAQSVVNSLYEGATFHVDSPVLTGYTANTLFVSGAMPAANVSFTITYTANYVPPIEEPTQPTEPIVQPPVEVEIDDEPIEVPAEPTKGLDLDPENLVIVPIEPDKTPLDDMQMGDHKDCVMHFILIIAAYVVYCMYISDKKKYQKKIHELSEELAMEKKSRGKDSDEE